MEKKVSWKFDCLLTFELFFFFSSMPFSSRNEAELKFYLGLKQNKTSVNSFLYTKLYTWLNISFGDFVCHFSLCVIFHLLHQTLYSLFVLPLVENKEKRHICFIHWDSFAHSQKQSCKMVMNIVEAQHFAGLISELCACDKLAAYC